MPNDNENSSSKDTKEKGEKIKSFCEKICIYGSYLCNIILFLFLTSLVLVLFYYIGFIIYDNTETPELARGVGILLSSIITVSGVYAGFHFNKRQTYKGIVTKERIEWLHRLQNNLSEYLKLTNSIMKKDVEKTVNEKEKAKLLIEEKKDKINKLYYEIIFNINHEEDKKALDAIKTYNRLVLGELDKITLSLALTKDIKLELLAIPGDEDELLLKIKDKSERDKLKGLIEEDKLKNILISNVKVKNKNKDKDKKEKELTKEISLLREEVSEEFTEIFKEVWKDIKEEAD